MSPAQRNRSLTRLILALLLVLASGVTSVSSASKPTLPRVAQHSPEEFNQILRENALFFNILVSFSFTAAIADPVWGLNVKDININLITRDVRDAKGHQLIRVRVAGVVRKNNNVELNILNPQGDIVGKGFFGYNSGQLTFYAPNDRPIINGYIDFHGNYILDDLRLPPGKQDLVNGTVDTCFYCSSLGYAWYDGLNVQVGGGRMYPFFSYGDDYVNGIRMYWTFEEGQIRDGVAATGEAEYDLAGEATGAINSALFDTERSAESFFANPYSLVPDPIGKALLPRFTNDTGVSVTNTSGQQIHVTYIARHPDGSLVSGDGIENPITYTFAEGQQFAVYPGELFRGLNEKDRRPILADGDIGWMEIYSDEGDIQAMFLDGNRDGTGLDGNVGIETGGNPIVFPDLRLKSNESTEIELLNLAYDDVIVRLELLDNEGNVLHGEPEFFIAGYGIRNFYLGGGSEFLRIGDPSLAASLRVSCNNTNSIKSSSCSKIIGLATYSDRFGSLASAYAVSGESAGSVLVGPYFVAGASSKGSWDTTVRVTKFGGESASVYLDLYGANGDLLVTFPKMLAPAGQASFVLDGSDLPWGDRFTTGYIRLRSDSGLIAGDVSLSWSDGNGSQLTSYPLSNNLYRALQFNQVAEGNAGDLGYWTGIALMNGLEKQVNVRVQIYRSDGSEDQSVVISLNPYGQYASLLSEFVDDPGYTRIGGYIRVTSADPISAIVLYGDSSSQFLAAVPGIHR